MPVASLSEQQARRILVMQEQIEQLERHNARLQARAKKLEKQVRRLQPAPAMVLGSDLKMKVVRHD